jgi:hypothetical protein
MSKLSSILFVLVAFVILVNYVESANSESNEETDIMDMENGDGKRTAVLSFYIWFNNMLNLL